MPSLARLGHSELTPWDINTCKATQLVTVRNNNLTVQLLHGVKTVVTISEVHKGVISEFLRSLHTTIFASSLLTNHTQSVFRCGEHQVTDVQNFYLEREGYSSQPLALLQLKLNYFVRTKSVILATDDRVSEH